MFDVAANTSPRLLDDRSDNIASALSLGLRLVCVYLCVVRAGNCSTVPRAPRHFKSHLNFNVIVAKVRPRVYVHFVRG